MSEGSTMAEELEGTLVRTPPVADPAALGLAGFALTTFVLSVHNAGWAPDLIWIGFAFFYGGLAQFLAGMWEFRNRNTFGAAAFSSYGAFWMSLAFLVMLDLLGKIPANELDTDLGWFLLAFAIFNTYMMIWSARTTVAIFLVFVVLEITEIVLFIGFFSSVKIIIQIGGVAGVIDALLAWYAASAAVGNSLSNRIIAPVGGPLWKDRVAGGR
jgi:succinate-acetate transporter protein